MKVASTYRHERAVLGHAADPAERAGLDMQECKSYHPFDQLSEFERIAQPTQFFISFLVSLLGKAAKERRSSAVFGSRSVHSTAARMTPVDIAAKSYQ